MTEKTLKVVYGQGVPGPQGAAGPQGPQGVKGDKGEPGTAANNSISSFEDYADALVEHIAGSFVEGQPIHVVDDENLSKLSTFYRAAATAGASPIEDTDRQDMLTNPWVNDNIAKVLSGSTSLDDALANTWTQITDSYTEAPDTTVTGVVFTGKRDADTRFQIAILDVEASRGEMYTRVKTSAGWTDWVRYINSVDWATLGTASVMDDSADADLANDPDAAARRDIVKAYVDAEVAVVAGATISLGSLSLVNSAAAHGLAAAPSRVSFYLQCTTAYSGWAIGDRIYHVSWQTDADASEGFTIWADATEVGFGVTGIPEVDDPAGTFGGLVAANWDVYAVVQE